MVASTTTTDNPAKGVDLEQAGNKEVAADARTVESRHSIRNQVADDIEKFLQGGGSINYIDPDVTADPPRKPESNYGSRAI